MIDTTQALLTELQAIDDREDRILDVLLRHGAALEESDRRLNTVTIADLRALRDGLASLEGIIDTLQADVAHAEAAAIPTPPSAPPDSVASNGHDTPANPTSKGHDTPAGEQPPSAPVPLPSMTFEQLAARVREQDGEAAQIKEVLRDRLLALGAMPADPAVAGVAAPVVSSIAEVPAPLDSTIAAVPVPVDPGAADRTFRLSNPPMTGNDVKRFQRDLNRRFEVWHIDIAIREDSTYGKATRHAARQVLLALGVDAADYEHGITPHLRMLIHTPSKRTAVQLAQAEVRRPWLRRLRKREAGSESKRKAGSTKSSGKKGSDALRVGNAAAAIEAHGGRHGDIIVREARRHGLPVALVCAVIEKETGFRNVFGHDRVRNPIKSPPKGLLEVTEARYKQYLKHRKAGEGCQGVGYMQLTSPGLQDKADGVGGCWNTGANIRIGCEFLAGNIQRLGSTRQGVRAYNGSGPAAEQYATNVLERERVWRRRLAKAKSTARPQTKPNRRPAGAKAAPRTFKLTKRPMRGSDVKRFQRDLNARFESWKIHSRISEDGEYGHTTRHAGQQVLLGLGIAPADYEHGVTPRLRSKIRNPRLRTPAEVARAKTRRTYLAKLRKRTNAKGGGALRLRAYAEAKRMLDKDVRESGGNNRGRLVMEIIKANNGPGPEPWCGDFMAWCYRKAGSKAITRAWASVRAVGGLAGVKRVKSPLKGNLVRFNFDHIGMFVCWCDASGRQVEMEKATHIKSIEGNTARGGAVAVNDSAGGGDGVYLKLRQRHLVSDFLHIGR